MLFNRFPADMLFSVCSCYKSYCYDTCEQTLHGSLHSFLLDGYLGVKLLGHVENVYLTF